MANEKRQRVFDTLEAAEAKHDFKEKEGIFLVTDKEANRQAYVIERSHPLARAAAALHWGFECKVASTKPREKQSPQQRAESAFKKLSDEERAELMAKLQSAE